MPATFTMAPYQLGADASYIPCVSAHSTWSLQTLFAGSVKLPHVEDEYSEEMSEMLAKLDCSISIFLVADSLTCIIAVSHVSCKK
jgi:hypothetical protein